MRKVEIACLMLSDGGALFLIRWDNRINYSGFKYT